jgi:hypothetical protein
MTDAQKKSDEHADVYPDIYAPPYSLTTLEDLEDLTDTEKREDKIVFYIMIAIIVILSAITIPAYISSK